jgi:hypothetical protein
MGKYDSIHAVMDFTEVLKNEPEKAFDFFTCNSYRFEKDDIINILKELLYSVKYHTEGSFYRDLYADILCDVQIELDEDYEEAYQEYDEWYKGIK